VQGPAVDLFAAVDKEQIRAGSNREVRHICTHTHRHTHTYTHTDTHIHTHTHTHAYTHSHTRKHTHTHTHAHTHTHTHTHTHRKVMATRTVKTAAKKLRRLKLTRSRTLGALGGEGLASALVSTHTDTMLTPRGHHTGTILTP
jgi:hypothetical protein